MAESEEAVLDGTAGGAAAPAENCADCEPAVEQAAEEPVDALPAILKCLKANHANTLALLDCLRACDVAPEDALPYRDVEAGLAGLPSMDLTMQTPHTLIGLLIKAGGIVAVPVEEPAPAQDIPVQDGEPAEEQAVDGSSESGESSSVEADGAAPATPEASDGAAPEAPEAFAETGADEVGEPADQPVDYVLYTTDAGREALAAFDPKTRFGELLAGEPDAYLELYARVLDICAGPDGASRAQIEADLKGHPALESPKRIYPEYFISKLETVGGLSWDGVWRTTEAGARILDALA